MTERDRIMKLLSASPALLAKVDAVLNGTEETAKADDDVRLCTISEAASRLNLSRPTIYRLVKMGRLEVVPLDGTNRIRVKSILAFANCATQAMEGRATM